MNWGVCSEGALIAQSASGANLPPFSPVKLITAVPWPERPCCMHNIRRISSADSQKDISRMTECHDLLCECKFWVVVIVEGSMKPDHGRKERAGSPPCNSFDSSGPSFTCNSGERGRERENCLTNSPAICSQSAQLPPFPHRRSLFPLLKQVTSKFAALQISASQILSSGLRLRSSTISSIFNFYF